MVRDHYQGICRTRVSQRGFRGRCSAATTVMSRISPVKAQGMAIFLSACGGAMLCMIFAGSPQLYVFTCIWVFGAGAGVLMSLSRTVVQQSASDVFEPGFLLFTPSRFWVVRYRRFVGGSTGRVGRSFTSSVYGRARDGRSTGSVGTMGRNTSCPSCLKHADSVVRAGFSASISTRMSLIPLQVIFRYL